MSNLVVTILEHSDYDAILTDWWVSRWGQAPTRDFLPDDGKGGFMVWDDETPVCAGFMYSTNSKVAWVTWIVANPEYKDRAEALQLLIDTMTDVCRREGFRYVFAPAQHTGLVRAYENAGYRAGTEGNVEYIKVL